MHGGKMIGSGGKERAATLTFNRNNKPFLVAAAQSFVMRPDRIVSDNVAVTFYLDKDSIYHPSVQFKYISANKELTLIRPSGKSNGTPYYDSYHDVDMYFDAMTWKLDDPLIDLKMISGEGEVKLWFESAKFFRSGRSPWVSSSAANGGYEPKIREICDNSRPRADFVTAWGAAGHCRSERRHERTRPGRFGAVGRGRPGPL